MAYWNRGYRGFPDKAAWSDHERKLRKEAAFFDEDAPLGQSCIRKPEEPMADGRSDAKDS